MDEIEIFYGAENSLTMNQTYTWPFQCQYELKRYPFDTQVNLNRSIACAHDGSQECKIVMTVSSLSMDTVKLLADQVKHFIDKTA